MSLQKSDRSLQSFELFIKDQKEGQIIQTICQQLQQICSATYLMECPKINKKRIRKNSMKRKSILFTQDEKQSKISDDEIEGNILSQKISFIEKLEEELTTLKQIMSILE